MLKYLPLIATIVAFVSGYAVLGWSVKEHHETDNARDAYMRSITEQNTMDIAVLKQIVSSIPEMQRDLKEILRRTR